MRDVFFSNVAPRFRPEIAPLARVGVRWFEISK